MKYYVIAGEASGDLHGSNLIKEIKKLDTAADFRGWGGDKMEAAGVTLVKHYRDLAFMGFVEVVKHLPTILKNIESCKKDILVYKPDAIILIDYPGVNLRMAKWAKQQGLKVIFYISPQVWAWKENRVKKMKQTIDKMLVILPFEKEYFKNKWNWDVEYVGHPLVEVIEGYSKMHQSAGSAIAIPRADNSRLSKGYIAPESPSGDSAETLEKNHLQPETLSARGMAIADPAPGGIVALLPGSRKQEIIKKLPVMLEVSKAFPSYQFIVAKAPGLDENFYDTLLKEYSNVSYVANKTYDLLLQARAALVTSGTATLETALFGVPEVVCYKGSNISYQIAKRVIKIKYISLVNLIMDKEVVKELIQDEMTTGNLTTELNKLLNDTDKQEQLRADYAALKKLLSQGGNASANAAKSIVGFLHS